METVETRMR